MQIYCIDEFIGLENYCDNPIQNSNLYFLFITFILQTLQCNILPLLPTMWEINRCYHLFEDVFNPSFLSASFLPSSPKSLGCVRTQLFSSDPTY